MDGCDQTDKKWTGNSIQYYSKGKRETKLTLTTKPKSECFIYLLI